MQMLMRHQVISPLVGVDAPQLFECELFCLRMSMRFWVC